MITAIWAEDREGGIGKNGDIPWQVPEDFAYFKEKTAGKPVIMGRKTWESLPKRPLSGRKNIIITKNAEKQEQNWKERTNIGDVVFVNSLKEALELTKKSSPFIIGGSQIYEEAMPFVDRIFVTKVKGGFLCDTFSPIINEKEFALLAEPIYFSSAKARYSNGEPIQFAFLEYNRIK